MFKQFASLSAAALLTAGLSAPASAAFINGSISFTDGFNTFGNIVSDLTAFDVGAVSVTTGSTGDFSAIPNFTPTTTAGFDTAAPAGTIYAVGGFSFELTQVGTLNTVPLACAGGRCSDEIGFNIAGLVSGNGFEPTAFTGSWTANGSCAGEGGQGNPTCISDITNSWSSSLTALGTDQVVPAPATLALFGLGLAGLGLARRKKA